MMFRAIGPNSNIKKPVVLCARHAEVLQHNLALLEKDRDKWGQGVHPDFEPSLVKLIPMEAKLFCRHAYTLDAVSCGDASMPTG